MFLKHECNGRGGKEDVNQRLMELQQEYQQRGAASLAGKFIWTVEGKAFGYLIGMQAGGGVGGEPGGDLLAGNGMPMSLHGTVSVAG
jgi:hypothetical protein